MVNLKEQLKFFKFIGEELKEKVECYVIGGSAMMFYDAKENTKDVDLVFMNGEDRNLVIDVLEKMGFVDKRKLIKIFRYEKFVKKNKPIMMVGKEEERFDLFLKEIICFKMSDSIIDRVYESHEFSNLIVKVVSPEDIILLKCATERAKDREDALELVKKFDIKWDIVIEESKHQTKLEEYLFPVFLFDFLYELKEDLKAEVPKDVIMKIRKISEELLIKKLGKKYK